MILDTRHEIDCHFIIHECTFNNGKKKIGLLFIPQRPDNKEPAQFLRDAPSTDIGKKAFSKYDIYFRQRDECKPAVLSEELAFLCSQGRRPFFAEANTPLCRVLDNNLGARDPGLIRFIGREEVLRELWRWLCDCFSPGKLLTGLGGFGKTTIARMFVEDIIRNCPIGFERVIWLSAKQKYYTAILDKYTPMMRVDFSDEFTLLRALLQELGSPEEMLKEDFTREELLDELVKSLQIIPSFIVIDDIDSLHPEHQNAVFHSMLQVMGQTIGTASVPSRVLLTARLSLCAAPSQLIYLKGLDFKNEFSDYVEMTCQHIGLPLKAIGGKNEMKEFHNKTQGSPTFISSILRLVALGDTLKFALKRWQGSTGEEVRKFAFQKELENLSDSQVRTLYALCILTDTSQVELQKITQSSDTRLRDDIDELRKYHLIAIGGEAPQGGAKFVIPRTIALMSDLIRRRVLDPKRIENACFKARETYPKIEAQVGSILGRVIALWDNKNAEEALEVAKFGDKRYKDNPYIKCLLGRAYLRSDPPDPRKADGALRKAHELGCQRPELFPLWIEAKRLLNDWMGVIEITRLADKEIQFADNLYHRAQAFKELGDLAIRTGNLMGAAEDYLEGGKEIHVALIKGEVQGRGFELKELRKNLLSNYIRMVDRLYPNPEEHIEVWLAGMDVFEYRVRTPDTIRLSLERLTSWWKAVEERGRYDSNAAEKLREQLRKIDRLLIILAKYEPYDNEILDYIQNARELLSSRIEKYISEGEKGIN